MRLRREVKFRRRTHDELRTFSLALCPTGTLPWVDSTLSKSLPALCQFDGSEALDLIGSAKSFISAVIGICIQFFS